MKIWTGSLSDQGSPVLKISISGPLPNSSQEFEAIIDTGFTGFLSMPLLKAFPLGLLLYGTVEVTLADGSTAPKITAKGAVHMGDELQVGVVILETSMTDILLGMDFLRKFNRVLFVDQSDGTVMLIKSDEFEALLKQSISSKEKILPEIEVIGGASVVASTDPDPSKSPE
jgi:predicted aspartyl protease